MTSCKLDHPNRRGCVIELDSRPVVISNALSSMRTRQVTVFPVTFPLSVLQLQFDCVIFLVDFILYINMEAMYM